MPWPPGNITSSLVLPASQHRPEGKSPLEGIRWSETTEDRTGRSDRLKPPKHRPLIPNPCATSRRPHRTELEGDTRRGQRSPHLRRDRQQQLQSRTPRDVSHIEDIPPAELPQARSTLRPYAASFPHAQTRWSPRREIGDLFSAPGFPLRAHRAKTTQRPRREGPQRPPLIVGAHHTDLAGAAPRDQTVTPVAALEMK